MTLFLILLCSLLPTAPVLGPLQPPKSEVGVDNEGFTVADPGEGLGWPAPPPHPPRGGARSPPFPHIFRPKWGPKFIIRWEGWTLKMEEEDWCTGTRNVLFWNNAILTLLVDMFPEQKKTQLDSICNPFVCLPYTSEIIHWFIICSSHVRESKTVLGCVPLRWSGSVIRDHLPVIVD